jgi:hypothetical protein
MISSISYNRPEEVRSLSEFLSTHVLCQIEQVVSTVPCCPFYVYTCEWRLFASVDVKVGQTFTLLSARKNRDLRIVSQGTIYRENSQYPIIDNMQQGERLLRESDCSLSGPRKLTQYLLFLTPSSVKHGIEDTRQHQLQGLLTFSYHCLAR